MVERILAATRSVLVERGYEGASTNRIAAVAGISPGSLYQYFPDKDAVVDRVVTSLKLETCVFFSFPFLQLLS